jgi:hypothetical protein
VELVCSCWRALRDYDKSDGQELWSRLLPRVRGALAKASLEDIADWMDCIRLAMEGEASGSVLVDRIFRFALGVDSPEQPLSLAYPGIESRDASSLEPLKLLKLTMAMMQEPVVHRSAAFRAELSPALRPYIAHPYKQIREAVAKLLTWVIKREGVDAEVARWATERMDELRPKLLRTRVASEVRTPEVLEASGLLYLLVHGVLARCRNVSALSLRCLPFIITCCTFADSEVQPLADTALNALALCMRPAVVPDALAALAPALRGEAESEDQGWAALQKQKTRALEFLSVVSLAGHLVLVGEGDPSRVANLEAAGVGALADQSVDVQAAGKRLLRAIFQIIPDNTVSERIVAFQTTAGRPGNGVNGNAVVGVLGLAAVSELVHSGSFAPWGPQALVALAEYGGAKAPQRVRNIVQSTLQNFFKAMQVDQQQWGKYQKYMTEEQLSKLQQFKGTHSYFS